MKTAALLFTLLFVTMIALSSTAHLKKIKLTTDATTDVATTDTPVLYSTTYSTFDGVASVNSSVPSISFGNQAGNFGTDNFTVTFWFTTSSTPVNNLADILGNRQQGSQGDFFSVRLSKTGIVVVELCDTSGNGNDYVETQSANSGLNNGEAHHVAVVRYGTDVLLYIDGVLSSQGTSGNPTDVTGVYPFKLGKSYSGFSPINISFDDLRIYYGTALSAAQVSSIYSDL
jgi:hypothetical protein